MPHLFVDISSHGFGHLAQTGPVLEALADRVADLRLTVRCGLPATQLAKRITPAFRHIHDCSDVAFVMHDATRIDLAASAAAYRAAHADWPGKVATEAGFLADIAADLVLSDISALPLAAARMAGIPAIAMCSLNWADQFAHLFADEPWAATIHAQLQSAYAGADAFLRCTPAMPMPDLTNAIDIPPLARTGRRQRDSVERMLGGQGNERLVLAAMGGIDFELPLARWPRLPGVRWLVGNAPPGRPDMTSYPSLGLHFTDLLASVDAVIGKPGYGMFVEAAAAGIPLLYLRRKDWPEQEVLIDWLQAKAVCAEVSPAAFASGTFIPQLQTLWAKPARRVVADGAAVAAAFLASFLSERRAKT